MADIKISQLGAAVAVADADVIPATANGVTVKVPARVLKEYAIGGTDISSIGDGTPTGAISALKSVKIEKTDIAPIETSVASKSYAVGDQLYYNGMLYSVIAAIAQGETLVVDTNIELSDKVTEQIKALNGEVSTLNEALTNEVSARATLGAHNLLDSIIDSDTQYGVTATKQSDGSFIISGEFESGHNYIVFILNSTINVKKGITYSVSGGISNNLYLEAWSGTDFDVMDKGSGVTFTPSADEVASFGIIVFSGATLPQRVYPMIRLTSDSDTTYRPYVPTNAQLLSYKDNGVLGAKNLFKNKLTSQVIHGITVTVNDDGSFMINGTNDGTDDSWGRLGGTDLFKLDIPSGDYIVSGAPSGATISNYCLKFYDEGDGTSTVASYMIQNGNEVLVHIDNTHYFSFYLWVGKNRTVSNVTFKPMIRLATDTDPTYKPYAMTNRELSFVDKDFFTVDSSVLTSATVVTKKIGKVVTIIIDATAISGGNVTIGHLTKYLPKEWMYGVCMCAGDVARLVGINPSNGSIVIYRVPAGILFFSLTYIIE